MSNNFVGSGVIVHKGLYLFSLLLIVSAIYFIFIFKSDIQGYFLTNKKEGAIKGAATAETYASMIVKDDMHLRSLAQEITKSCPEGDKACQAYKVYRYIMTDLQYFEDSDGNEIAGTDLTINRKGGDCEDLSILLSSLLENLDISTKLALTNNHAFVYVCNIPKENLYKYIKKDMQKIPLFSDNVRLAAGQVWTFKPALTDKGEKYDIIINSDIPVDLYAFEKSDDIIIDGNIGPFIKNCSRTQVTSGIVSCQMHKDNLIAVAAVYGEASFNLVVKNIGFKAEDIDVDYIGSEPCIPFDPSIRGDNEYPGATMDNKVISVISPK